MLSTLSRVTSRRIWFVPRLSVWGASQWCNIDFLGVEEVESTLSILYGSVGIGESAQDVKFSDLVDFRGNSLPATISNPRVLVRGRSCETAFIVGDESNQGFKIAGSDASGGPVVVDLMIVELGD